MAADEREFLDFFADQYWPLRRVGFLLTGDWHQADELAQDAMARTYAAWGRLRRRDRAAAYARKVLLNRYRSLARRARVETWHLLASRREDQDRYEPDFSGDGQLLWAELQRLPASAAPSCCASTLTFPRRRSRACSACRRGRSSPGPIGG